MALVALTELFQVVPDPGYVEASILKTKLSVTTTGAVAGAVVSTDAENLRGIDYLLSGIRFRNITQIVGAVVEYCHDVNAVARC